MRDCLQMSPCGADECALLAAIRVSDAMETGTVQVGMTTYKAQVMCLGAGKVLRHTCCGHALSPKEHVSTGM